MFFKNIISQVTQNWKLMILNGFIVYVIFSGVSFVFWRVLPYAQNSTSQIATESGLIFKALHAIIPLALVTGLYALFGFIIIISIYVATFASFGNEKNLVASFKNACDWSNFQCFLLKVVGPTFGLWLIWDLAAKLIGHFSPWYMIVFGLYTVVPLYAIIALLASRFIMAMYTDANIKFGINKLPSFKRIKNLGLLLVPVITVGLFLAIKFLGLTMISELVILAIFWVVSIGANQALVIHLDSLKREVV